MSESIPLLQMTGISKSFPGVKALSDVSLTLHRGEVLALMGENGAGKSTLMKILGGAYLPDSGTISIDGQPVTFRNVSDSKKRGIALIHQELMLAPNLDIAGNIFLGNEPRTLLGKLDQRTMRRSASELMQRVGLNLPPTTPVSTLTAGRQQMVEIAKALALNAKAIIMDEPTSSLTSGESEQLFQIIAALKSEGIGIIYISHRMEEVLMLADRITILRDGKYIGDLSRADATQDKIVSMMVGRSFSTRFADRPPRNYPPSPAHRSRGPEKGYKYIYSAPSVAPVAGSPEKGDITDFPILILENIVVPGTSHPLSFDVYKGEILGLAGLVGSGRTELMQVIAGVDAALSGKMTLEGEPYFPRTPKHAISRGVYLAPEDRKRHGLVLPMSVAENTTLPSIANYSPAGLLNRHKEVEVATAEVQRMRIKTPSIQAKVINLSGGNQQKVVLGKWLAMNPKILILDEPTRGIDVGAKTEIYRIMTELSAQGITILMVSSEMEEVIGMSDRIVVMHESKIKAIVPRAEATQDRIGSLMAGVS
jgi:ribose transport system ATP-binding protein